MKRLFIFSIIIQLVLYSCFLFFCWQADQSMNKSGIGDLKEFKKFSKYGVIALYSGILTWLLIVSLVTIKKLFGKNYAQTAIALPPLFLTISWVLLWFI